MNKKLFFSALMVAGMAGALAAEGGTQIMTPGAMNTCGDYMSARRANDARSYWAVAWTWGYISRYNRESPAARIDIPAQTETVHLYLEKFCRENPLDGIFSATEKLILDLGGNPQKSWPRR